MESEIDSKEKYANWEASAEEPEEEAKESTQDRADQTFSSRLAEYLTGMRPENPAMIERLIADKTKIRAKYGLPPQELSPSEFERALQHIAKKLDTKIRAKHEYSRFFKENPLVGAVYFNESNEVATNIDRNNIAKYFRSLNVLEHELIHAMQDRDSPSMPIEEMEYEAYVAGVNVEHLRANPDDVNDILFNFLIGGSVKAYYQIESKRRGEKISPEWDTPEYFLNRDKALVATAELEQKN